MRVLNLLASAQLYDPATNTISAAPSMSAPRAFHAATTLAGGEGFVVGAASLDLLAGTLNAETLNGCEQFDPATDTWTPCVDPPLANIWRDGVIICLPCLFCPFLDSTYVTGAGVTSMPLAGGPSGAESSVLEVTPATGAWSTASLTAPREGTDGRAASEPRRARRRRRLRGDPGHERRPLHGRVLTRARRAHRGARIRATAAR